MPTSPPSGPPKLAALLARLSAALDALLGGLASLGRGTRELLGQALRPGPRALGHWRSGLSGSGLGGSGLSTVASFLVRHPLRFPLLLGAALILFTVVRPASVTPKAAGNEWIRLGDPGNSSWLRVPSYCVLKSCSLVVVSHGRAQTAERLRDSPNVTVLTNALLEANFAVLLSSDGGMNTWGSPQALQDVSRVHRLATEQFVWNRRTYALGISMGGLLSLRSALPTSPYQVQGVALVDAWTSLRAAWDSALSRRNEIQTAYQRDHRSLEFDPLPSVQQRPPIALFVAYSREDGIVPSTLNAEPLLGSAKTDLSEFVRLSGPHLGGNRFTPELAGRLVGFFKRLEGRGQGWQMGRESGN